MTVTAIILDDGYPPHGHYRCHVDPRPIQCVEYEHK